MKFICFEGIDGSGKTTLSEILLKELKAKGCSVVHFREGKKLLSPVANGIREFAKDPANLSMGNWTEALLYMAREKQLLDEKLQELPKDENLFVIADRSLYSPLVMARDIRGIDDPVLEQLTKSLWGDVTPDLTLFCDVDLDTSVIRKKIAKFGEAVPGKINSRKGLWGLVFREKMREGYHRLARENKNWVCIDNNANDPKHAFKKIWKVFEQKFGLSPLTDEVSEAPHHSLYNSQDAQWNPNAITEAFYGGLEHKHPYLQGFLLQELNTESSWQKREALFRQEPGAGMLSLKGCAGDARFQPYVQQYSKSFPIQTLKLLPSTLTDVWHRDEYHKIYEHYPNEVLANLAGNQESWVWDLRENAPKELYPSVLLSLAEINTERAFELTEKLKKGKFSDAVVLATTGRNDSRAWELRNKYFDIHPWAVLLSISKIEDPRAHQLRTEWVEAAPKLVARSLKNLFSDSAWALRQKCMGAWPELLASIKHCSDSRADAFRKNLIEKAPAEVLLSLGGLWYSESFATNPWIDLLPPEKRKFLPVLKTIYLFESNRSLQNRGIAYG
jgi:dTMP kinase